MFLVPRESWIEVNQSNFFGVFHHNTSAKCVTIVKARAPGDIPLSKSCTFADIDRLATDDSIISALMPARQFYRTASVQPYIETTETKGKSSFLFTIYT